MVAESDVEAAYQAMDQRMQRSISKCGVDNQEQHRLLQECHNNLRRNIERIVEPVSDEAFHVYVKRNDDAENAVAKAEAEEENDDDMEYDEEDDDTEYDEEDLLDPEAIRRVQELRQQIRSQAASVQAIRNQVLDQAIVLGQRQVNFLQGSGKDDGGSSPSVPLVDTTRPQEQLKEMQESITNMVVTLDKAQQDIPDKLASLQETIAVIEENLRKTEEGTLSQTEQAILRHDEDTTEEGAIDLMQDSSSNNNNNKPPERRLASFLGQN